MATNYRDKIKESNQYQKNTPKKTPIIRLTHDFIRFGQAKLSR